MAALVESTDMDLDLKIPIVLLVPLRTFYYQ